MAMSIEQEIARNARIANMIIPQFSRSDLMPFMPDNYEIARQGALQIINEVSDNEVLTTFKYSKKFISKLSDNNKRLYNKALSKIAMLNKKPVYSLLQEKRDREIEIITNAGFTYEKGVLSTISREFRDLFAVLSYAEIQEIKEHVLSNNQTAELEDILVKMYDEMSKYKQEELKKLKATQRENIKRWGEEVISSKQLLKNPKIERMLQGLI